jgi:hypothetical protein
MLKKKILASYNIKRNYPKFLFNQKDKKLFKNDTKRKIPSVYSFCSKRSFIFSNNFVFDLNKFKFIYTGQLFEDQRLTLSTIKNLIKHIFFYKILNFKNCLILTDKYSLGYFHFLAEVLPKLEFYKDKYDKELLLIENNIPNNWIRYFLSSYKIKYHKLDKNSLVFAKNLKIISSLAGTGNFRAKYIQQVNARFTKNQNILHNKKIIFILRKKIDREIINQGEVNNFLDSRGILKIDMEDFSIQKQIQISYNSRIIIGIHGGGLTNICWMNLKKRNALIEIRDNNDNYNNCYFNLATSLNVDYYYLKSKSQKARKDFSKKRLTGKYLVDIDQLDFLIKKIKKKIF